MAESDRTRSPGGVDEKTPPVLCPGDRAVADLRLVLLGVRIPFTVLGGLRTGPPAESPAEPHRVRIAVTAGEAEAAHAAGRLVITDAESNPIAELSELSEPSGLPGPSNSNGSGKRDGRIEGTVAPLGGRDASPRLPAHHGPDRIVVAVSRPLTSTDLDGIRSAGTDSEVVLVLPTTGTSLDGLPAAVLRRCLERAAPPEWTRLPLPMSRRGAVADRALALAVGEAVGATQLWLDDTAPAGHRRWLDTLRSLQEAITATVETDDPVLAQALPALTRWRPPRRHRGLVVFFTGLSGSGKSTLARALMGHLTSRTDRSATLLDGDLVRRLLSSGLGFDRAGRDLNVRRIGFVAAEVARHGGIAVCAPIAPYADSRAAVRRLVEEVGDLVLVHVATPLAECERRDTKGLYRKARAGLVTQFTGISDPYDVPLDAELRVDTSGASLDESLAEIVECLGAGGWLAR